MEQPFVNLELAYIATAQVADEEFIAVVFSGPELQVGDLKLSSYIFRIRCHHKAEDVIQALRSATESVFDYEMLPKPARTIQPSLN